MFDNKLFEEQESTLVVDSLSQLNLSYPQVRGIGLFAIITLKVSNHEFDDKALLKESTIEDFLLNGKFNLDTSRMWLSPHEASIHKLHSLQSLNLLKT